MRKRGNASWHDSRARGRECARRILLAKAGILSVRIPCSASAPAFSDTE